MAQNLTPAQSTPGGIKILDPSSVHSITSGQVVVDLQTAVKELVENSLDAGAPNIEVRFKDYGLDSFEVIDNGTGIPPQDYDSIALKHHTSKLSSFTDLQTVATFGFRGEALASLCALVDSLSVTTATASEAPVGTVIEFERSGKVKSKKGKVARQRGTTVLVSGLFKPLPVRRKELERNAKREYGKALTLLHAYALVPCAKENKGVRLSVTNQTTGSKKNIQLSTSGTPSTRASVSSIWGPRALENLVDLDLSFVVEVDSAVLRRLGRTRDDGGSSSIEVKVRGLVSKFAVGCGRSGTDRQFFFVNGRPCSPSKVQKAFNEVYRSFNATQAPFIIADFILPTNSCDINVSPDKRTILLHSENNLVQALKIALEEAYAPSRSTFDVNTSQARNKADAPAHKTPVDNPIVGPKPNAQEPLFLSDEAYADADTDKSPAVSQPSSNVQIDEHSELSGTLDDESHFGEPVLLVSESNPVPSSSAPSSSQEAVADIKSNLRPRLSTDTTASLQVHPVSPSTANGSALRQGQSHTVYAAPPSNSPSHSYSHGRGVPASPAGLLASVARKRMRSSSPTVMDEQEETEEGSSSESRRNDIQRGAPLPDSDSRSPPILSIRPPARQIARATVQPIAGGSAHGGSSRGEQMVLSTSGASWSLRKGADGAEPPRKKSRVVSLGGRREGREAQVGMRDMLRGFARAGSRVAADEVKMDVAEDEGEDVGEKKDGAREETDTLVVGADESHDMELGEGGAMEVEEGIPRPEVVDFVPDRDLVPLVPVVSDTSGSDLASSNVVATGDEVVRTGDDKMISLTVDLPRMVASWEKLRAHLAAAQGKQVEREDDTAGRTSLNGTVKNTTHDEEAVEVLSRVIDKSDFAAMEVLGQFNLGFIIVRRCKPCSVGDGGPREEMDDLFIVDQHAADEKYNFENLQRTTKIDSQKLFRPLTLELTAADELVALENIAVLRQNGFELDIDEDRPAGQRIHLTAQPISQSTVFDTKDLEELLHLMQDRPSGQMVRCSKARAMFAMRACRKSVMIGTPLKRGQMTSIVQHMGTMDQPWHCPHGRPTMRHMSDIVGVGWDRRSRPVDWAAFGRVVAAAEA